MLIFGACSAQVYEGTIGKSRVTVCFGDAEDFSEDGVYYYDRHRSMIYLSRDKSKTNWFEKEERLSDEAQAVWNLNATTTACLHINLVFPKQFKFMASMHPAIPTW